METKTTPLLRRLREEKEGRETCPPEQVHKRMEALLSGYNAKKEKTLLDYFKIKY